MPTANYLTQANAHSRRVQWLVEIDLDRCDLDYTVSPCTASLQADGDRCFFSFLTCQDPANFDQVTRTYSFCLNDVPWADPAVAVWPLLERIVTIPQEIRFSKLFIYPEKLTLNFKLDHLPLPVDADKPIHNTARVGEFWRNLFARNRHYAGRAVRVYRGFAPMDNTRFLRADFDKVGPDYIIRGVKHTKKGFAISVESPLAEIERKKVPWTISEDNLTVLTLSDSATVLSVTDAGEFPDPANFTRNKIYIEVEGEELSSTTVFKEKMEVTSVDLGLDQLTVVRTVLGSFNTDFKIGATVTHIAFFGDPDPLDTPVADNDVQLTRGPDNPVEVLQDLLEWADVAAADVDTASFDFVKNQFWPRPEVLRLLSKPQTISKMMQEIREIRSIAIIINQAGKWAAQMLAPSADPDVFTQDHILEGSSHVLEDDAKRLTRVGIFWDPTDADESSSDPKDYRRGIVLIDTDLESANAFGEKKDTSITDPWLARTTTSADVRRLAASLIAFRRFGERRIKFELDLTENVLNVGDVVTVQNGIVSDGRGEDFVMPCIIIKKSDSGRSKTAYDAIDANFGGPYLRIGPDKMTQTATAKAAADTQYGYWGDPVDNRIGLKNEEGYIFF